MPNIVTSTANTAGFVPQVWAQRALDILRANIAMTRIVTRDSKFEPAWKGQTLNIPYPGTFTAQDKAENGAATVQVPTGSSVPVTLDKHKYVDFIVEDYAQAQASSNLLDRYVSPAAIALAEAVENDLFALYASLTGTSVGTSGTDISLATVRSARKALNDAKAPQNNRALVISSKDEIALLGDNSAQSYFANAQPQGVREGSMGRLYGFDVYMSQLVPVVAGAPNSTKNIAMVPDAMILATRPFMDAPGGSGVQQATVQDPETGLIIRVQYQYSMSDRGTRVGFDILYGARALRPTLGSVVLS